MTQRLCGQLGAERNISSGQGGFKTGHRGLGAAGAKAAPPPAQPCCHCQQRCHQQHSRHTDQSAAQAPDQGSAAGHTRTRVGRSSLKREQRVSRVSSPKGQDYVCNRLAADQLSIAVRCHWLEASMADSSAADEQGLLDQPCCCTRQLRLVASLLRRNQRAEPDRQAVATAM